MSRRKLEYSDARHGIEPMKCHMCGKSFVPAAYHVYHVAGAKRKRVCSYTCMLESERQREKTRKKTGRPPKKRNG